MSSKKIHVGLKMLLHNKVRLLLSILGIAFSVLIMFLQLGFFNGVNDSQAHMAEILNADLVVLSQKRNNLNRWNRMERRSIQQLLALPGVKEVVPVYKNSMALKNNQTEAVKRIIVYSFPPGDPLLNIPGFDALSQKLKTPSTAIYDSGSRKIYGAISIGETVDLSGVPYRIAGYTSIGPNLVNDGAILISEGSLFKHMGHYDQPIMILVRLAPGADIETTKTMIRNLESLELDAYTPDELHDREIAYTIKAAPVGAIFGIGLLVGLVIGTIISYQILFNEITDHLSQYATLKAMGYNDGFLRMIILEESIFLAILGFIPGLIVSAAMYQSLANSTSLLMTLTPERIVAILLLTVLMCLSAGLLALKKVLKADPADLY